MPILITHKNAPIHFQLNHQIAAHNDDETNVSVLRCQISSNLFFYTTFLSELSSSAHFSNRFYQLLIQLNKNSHSRTNRKLLKYLFTSIYWRPNQIYLQVHNRINQYDEWINRLW